MNLIKSVQPTQAQADTALNVFRGYLADLKDVTVDKYQNGKGVNDVIYRTMIHGQEFILLVGARGKVYAHGYNQRNPL